jgi:hypothetical protein
MVDVDDLASMTTDLLETRRYHFTPGFGATRTLPAWRVAQPDFLLPVLLRFAEELWREESQGGNFGLWIQEDKIALTGFRLRAVQHVPASIALLTVDEVLRRIAGPDGEVPWERLEAYAREVG